MVYRGQDQGVYVSQVGARSRVTCHVSRVTCHVYHVSRVQVVGGGAAARAGLRRGDRVVRINSKVPRSLEEAVSLLKKSKVG